MNDTQEVLHYTEGGGMKTLPNATAVLVLGILSIIFCFCYGFVGLILGIIALVISRKDLAAYREQPQDYNPSSYNNLKAGRTCATIGLIASAIAILSIIIYFIFMGSLILGLGSML